MTDRFSVGSGKSNQYSYEIPHKYLPGWGNLSEKIISTKCKYCFPNRICSNFFSFMKPKITLIFFHSFSFLLRHVIICCTTHCHSLSRVVSRYHSLSLVVICCHSMHHLFITTLSEVIWKDLLQWILSTDFI